MLVTFTGCARFVPQPINPADTAARLDARTLDDPGLRAFLETNLQRPVEVWPLRSWNLEALTLAGAYYSPALDVARAQWDMTQAGKKTAAARPNPSLTVEPGYDINPASGVTPWLPLVTLDIPVETAGKRSYRQAEAQYLADAARLNIATTAWAIRSNLRTHLLDFVAARERAALLRKQQSLQEEIVRLFTQQLQAGAVAGSEVTLMRMALDKIRLDSSEARQQAAEAKSLVAAAIGVSPRALEGVDLVFELALHPGDPPVLDLTSSETRGQALRHRADILGALSDYAASQSALQLEIARQYPDIHLGPGYQYDLGEHKFSLALTAELPLLNQNQGPIAQAEARRAETAARFNALQAEVAAAIDRAAATFRVAAENITALEELAASEEERNRAVEAQVQAGAAARFDLLNAQLELAASQLLQLNGRWRLQQSLGALEDALQRPVGSMGSLLSNTLWLRLTDKNKL